MTKDKKNILYFNGHARYSREYGTVGEIIKRLQEDEKNDVFYLDCNNAISGYCWLTRSYHKFYCKKCINNCRKVVQATNLPTEKHLKMKKYPKAKLPNFKSIDEILDFEYKGYKLGFGVVTTMMTATRDYNFDINKEKKHIKNFLEATCCVMDNIIDLHKKYKFDEIHLFNGRFSINYPVLLLAEKYNLPYTTYEHGSKIDKIWTIKNSVPHNINMLKENIVKLWKNAPEDKIEIAKKWFEDRRAGKYQTKASFTKDQIKDLLPTGYDFNKENIVIFNSSIDEIHAFKEWNLPFGETENKILESIFEKYKNDDSKCFYLRIHPNLTKAKENNTTQIREINEFKKKYKNLFVIEPDEKIDTYALIEAANKILVAYSTVGCEATYWGKTSILYGKAPYENLDCTHKANSLDELFKLIETKDLKPKPKENSLPYGFYYETFGDKYRYFKVDKLGEGEFLGIKFVDKKKFKISKILKKIFK